ncbi:SPFH domain-containing protein [Iamia majanohamensis]|uniref:SPFH domain-containing protein n=1 Tax=Iamia majanohamensis TaxID=467976 RepID=A0AAF0BRS6_9ACTN|nr:flotillin family protein [Iamia majanohamensis]WCO67221.1 SPFH domain-containing protein [Iamia majanohamensis]
MSPVLIAAAGLAALVVFLIAFVITRVKVAGPNEAFVITGRKGKAGADATSGQKVVLGASVFVVPFVQKLGVIGLTSRQIGVSVPAAVSANGIRCTLEGVAVVKVGGTEELIRAAAQRFLGQQTEIDVFTREVLAGSLRAIVGRLSVEEIIRDRAAFAGAVAEEAENSLTGQGLVLDTFQLQDIQAEGDYLLDLGRPEAARAEKEAAIAEAVARRESEQARILAEEEIAVANRELALKQAEIKALTDAAAANAAASGPLAQAAKDQEVIQAQEQVAARRADLKERELDTEVRKPADAARYATEQQAAADKARDIADAEAEAEQVRLSGAAERERRTALAEAIRAEGQAEADSIAARGEAEAEAMAKKAEAYEHYGEAAIIDIVADTLPKVVAEAASPMASIDQMTVISTDGASQTVKSVASTVAQGQELAKTMLGVDLGALLQGFVEARQGGDGAGGVDDGSDGDGTGPDGDGDGDGPGGPRPALTESTGTT